MKDSRCSGGEVTPESGNPLLLADLAGRLVQWFRRSQRDLPWRRDRTPYRVWVSEVMLQQTQVATVIPYYLRFLDRFPTLHHLAAAPLEEVLKLWEGMGYYSRAVNLHKGARMVAAELGGLLPAEKDALRLIPGLGEYTAAAVASIAFGQRVPAVDGNVLRVASRLFAIEDNVASQAARNAIGRRLEGMMRTGEGGVARKDEAFTAGEFNETLMEFGARICLPRNPQCADCPVFMLCAARRSGLASELPKKVRRDLVPLRQAVGVLVFSEGRLLVRRRTAPGLFSGLWEFPWEFLAQSEPETLSGMLKGIFLAAPLVKQGEVEQSYTHFRMRLAVHRGEVMPTASPGPLLVGGTWVDQEQLAALPCHGIVRKVLKGLTSKHWEGRNGRPFRQPYALP